ncbi:hypothetical protein FBR02_03230 [Anaerolineae bacterium CFX9]|jgi:chromosome segregation ATPase|nr:hypothetical protein [Kamptonema cortianum]MDL1899764.1 hypothetical protein [Anaerolineae bacterium CFX9]
MDLQQAARMIEWLDEERRRDKALISTLQERLASQQEMMDALARRLNSVESDQTVIRTEVTQAGRDNELLDLFRKEMQQIVESVEAKRLTAERENERRAELARETILRQVRELTDKQQRFERTTTEIPALNSEKDRLTGQVNALSQRVDDLFKRLDEPERRLAYLEEQRRQDARRLGELENELPELRRQFDALKPKVTLLEDIALRNERKIQDLQNGERDRREQIQQFIDQQTLVMQQRDQQVADLVKRFKEQEEVMQLNIERFETWAEAYREMKRIIDDFERIGERLERRINEVAEMQRLSEERFRTEWNDWRTEDQKRWKQYTVQSDDVWRQHDRDFERFVQRMVAVEETLPPLQDSLARIWNLERERAQLYRERYQSLLLAYDTVASSASANAAAPSSASSSVPAAAPPRNGGTPNGG